MSDNRSNEFILIKAERIFDGTGSATASGKAVLLNNRQIAAVGDRAGTLAAGRPGDVLVVGGNPTSDLNALWDIKDVYKSGLRVERPV